jgi:hypothetical protein
MTERLLEDLRPGLEGRRLVFTVTTGRSGTGYLANLLKCVPGVGSYHEPEPRFSDVMREAQSDPGVALQFLMERKLLRISQDLAPIYVETSHVFCKGFLEPLLEIGPVPDIIVLSRCHRYVATSLYRLGAIPGRTDLGVRWYLGPEDPGVLALPGWKSLHDYQLCYWYCLEIERRAREYEHMLAKRRGRVVRVSLNQLKTIPGFRRFMRNLDLPALGIQGWICYLWARGKRVNVKDRGKSKIQALSLSKSRLESLEQEVRDILEPGNAANASISMGC